MRDNWQRDLDNEEAPKQAELDFHTEQEAGEFIEWVCGRTGNRLEQDGVMVRVPEGVGCEQDTLDEWRRRWET